VIAPNGAETTKPQGPLVKEVIFGEIDAEEGFPVKQNNIRDGSTVAVSITVKEPRDIQ
jgi:hypothetical protein